MIPYRPDRVLVQTESWQDKMTAEILGRLVGVPVSTIDRTDDALAELSRSSDPRVSGKKTLILARNAGRFMKVCPGSGAEICCNYYVLNFALNCHFECTYCILQSYLGNPALVIFTNCEALLAEVAGQLAAQPERFYLPAYVGPRGWVALRLDRGAIDWEEVSEIVTMSYRLAAPKTLVKRLPPP